MRRRGVTAVLVAGALVSAACGDPTIPGRAGVYSFADTLVFGVDTTIDLFRWPPQRVPVRFWADPRGNMAFLVARAIATWEEQFLYGEFRGAAVADSNAADVIVRWADSVPPDVPPDPTLPNSCGGLTTLDFDASGVVLAGPVHVSLSVLTGGPPATGPRVQGCMRRMAIHEIGHALGLLRHSQFPEDIMFGSASVDYPSQFDRRTVQVLYHSTPTITPP